jgi:hypothetical protein
MRHGFVLAALFLPLCGCYVPPQPAPAYGYAASGYPAPEYEQPGYAPDPYGVQGDPGYGYGAAPTIIEGGAAVPLVLFGSEWGYYDHERHWHRAPDQYQHQGWAGHPGGPPPHFEGHPPPHYEGRPPQAFEGRPPQAYQGRPPQAYEGHPPPGGGRYGAPWPGRPPEAVRPAAAPYQAPQPAPPPQAAPQQRGEREQHNNRGCQPNQHC